MHVTWIIPALLATNIQTPIEDLSSFDRNTQSAAVARVAQNCLTYEEALFELWQKTDRFDVRSHVAEVFAKMGPRGIPRLIRLTRIGINDHDWAAAELITRHLSRFGDAAVQALIEDVEVTRSANSHIVAGVVEKLAIDPVPVLNRLLESRVPEARLQAFQRFVPVLSLEARTTASLLGARDIDPRIRNAAAADPGFPIWSDEDRRRLPELHRKYVAALQDLLDSPDDSVVEGACRRLSDTGPGDEMVVHKLRTIHNDPHRSFWVRTRAMTAHIRQSSDPRIAINEIVSMIDSSPDEVCIALAPIDPQYITDECIEPIVAAVRWTNSAEDLIASFKTDTSRSRLGLRALPALIKALSSPDIDLSGTSARIVGALGRQAISAVPELITQLRMRGASWQGVNYVDALLAIEPDNPDVRRVLTELIEPGEGKPLDVFVAGNALRELLRIRPDADWVRKLARVPIESPLHPLHEVVVWAPPAELAEVLESNESVLIADLANTTVRDLLWEFGNGKGSDPGEFNDIARERDRRSGAAEALSKIPDPTPEAIKALLGVLQSAVYETPLTEVSQSLPPAERRRANFRYLAQYQEAGVAGSVAHALARILDRNPQHFAHVIDSLRNHPKALAIVLADSVWDSQVERPLTLPSDLPAELMEIASSALMKSAEAGEPSSLLRWKSVRALSRFPASDDRRTALLVKLTLFGPGEDLPRTAIRGLGRIRPVKLEVLDIVTSHLDDPRVSMRLAALAAVEEAGDAALPLVDRILEIGRRQLRSSTAHEVGSTLRRLAPADPRVASYIAEYNAANPTYPIP